MLEEKIFSDYKEALKSKDSLRSSVLSFLRAELKNVAMSKNRDLLDDADCIAVIKKQIKRREDSIQQFRQGNRPDLADKEEKESLILKDYLPPQLSAADLSRIIEESITSLGASGLKDMGRVMKEVTSRTGASADARQVSEMVRIRLAAS